MKNPRNEGKEAINNKKNQQEAVKRGDASSRQSRAEESKAGTKSEDNESENATRQAKPRAK